MSFRFFCGRACEPDPELANELGSVLGWGVLWGAMVNLHVCVSQCFEGTEGCVGYASLQVTQSLEQTVPECQTAPDPASHPDSPRLAVALGGWNQGLGSAAQPPPPGESYAWHQHSQGLVRLLVT